MKSTRAWVLKLLITLKHWYSPVLHTLVLHTLVLNTLALNTIVLLLLINA